MWSSPGSDPSKAVYKCLSTKIGLRLVWMFRSLKGSLQTMRTAIFAIHVFGFRSLKGSLQTTVSGNARRPVCRRSDPSKAVYKCLSTKIGLRLVWMFRSLKGSLQMFEYEDRVAAGLDVPIPQRQSTNHCFRKRSPPSLPTFRSLKGSLQTSWYCWPC